MKTRFAFLALALAGCSSDPAATGQGAAACVEGRAESCACSGEAEGVQICAADGTYGPCDCGSGGAGGADGAGGGAGAAGENHGGGVGGSEPDHSGERVGECDMTGYWIARQTSFSTDTLVGATIAESEWHFFKFSQSGDSFVVDAHLGCGAQWSGVWVATPAPAADRALLYLNGQDGSGMAPARRGRSSKMGSSCAFEMDRWYGVRGAEDRFLPSDFSSKLDLDELQPLPWQEDRLDEPTHPDGSTDLDADGWPGMAWSVETPVEGTRHTAQRFWTEYSSDAAWPIEFESLEFTARSVLEFEENLLGYSACPASCSALDFGRMPSPTHPARVTFRYLGPKLTGSAVAAVLSVAPGSDVEADLNACQRVRDALPHDDTTE